MAEGNEGVEKALESVEEADKQVERDEEKLAKDQEKLKEAIEKAEEAAKRQLIKIFVGKTPYEVRPGDWQVSALKAELGIDAAKVLAEITPQGLVDLEDSQEIKLHEDERFMTHARKGGSS